MFSRALAAILALAGTSALAAIPAYKAAGSVPLGAPDRWDYAAFDQASGRVYVAHGDRLSVVDGRAGKMVGIVSGIAGGTHGVVIVGTPSKGITDDGKNGTAVFFEPVSLRTTGRAHADVDADGIAADPASGHVFVVNGDPASLTVIDPATERAIATIAVGEKPEFAVADGKGALFVAGEANGDVVRVDTRFNKVTARWPAASCKSPHGLAYDPANRRLFLGCVNSEMIVLDADSGAVVTILPIGRGSDAIAFDPSHRRVFSSNGLDGTVSVYQQLAANRYVPLAPIKTAISGRTMTLDPNSGRLFVVAADTDPNPIPRGRPKPRPGTLRLMIFDPVG